MIKKKITPLLLSLMLLLTVDLPNLLALANAEESQEVTGEIKNGMYVDKRAELNEDGSKATITLEAFATGSKTVDTIEEDVPTDIVLVLDQSGSMSEMMDAGGEYVENSGRTNASYYYNRSNLWFERNGDYERVTVTRTWWRGYDYTYSIGNEIIATSSESSNNPNIGPLYNYRRNRIPRLEALKNSLYNFQSQVAEKAKGEDGILGTEDDVNHRIAVVGFASDDTLRENYRNTEILKGTEQYNYRSLNNDIYRSAFLDMDNPVDSQKVIESNGILEANGGTRTDLGIQIGNNIFKNNPVNEETRNQVMIVFTDGVPGMTAWDESVANAAVNEASKTKSDYGATVYSIGIFDGADATSAGAAYGSDIVKANRFMHRISSNNGEVPGQDEPGYYLSAADAGTLDNIFEQISQQIEEGSTSVDLGTETVVKDVISSSFELPEGTTPDSIKLETYKYLGDNKWEKNLDAMGAEASVNDDEVSVTGFDFKKHFVSIDENQNPIPDENGNYVPFGHKLVISFDVDVKDLFLGGNDVLTNESAGIFRNSKAEKAFAEFKKPKVNIQINPISAELPDKKVYLSQGVTAAEIKAGSKITVKSQTGQSDIQIKPNEENYGLEAWQNEYVDINIIYRDKEGKKLENYDNLVEDQEYSLEVTITPKETTNLASELNKAEQRDIEKTGNIYVFKPELSFVNLEEYYGEKLPNYKEKNPETIIWKHDNEKIDETMENEPNITLDYDLPDNMITEITDENSSINIINTKENIPVNASVVKVGENEENYIDHVKFINSDGGISKDDPQFFIKVKTLELQISKIGDTTNEPHVLKVQYKPEYPSNASFDDYTELTIVGNDSATIKELPVGSYKIVEDVDWSWRYDSSPIYSSNPIKLVKDGSNNITVKNILDNNNWLNGFSKVLPNVFGQKKQGGNR